MPAQQMTEKSFVTVSEMADLCQLSRSRFYSLIDRGVFPKPVQHPSCKRPMYDLDLKGKCLQIRQTGVGMNGPVLFNRRPRRGQPKPKRVPEKVQTHAELLEALKGLGMTTTVQAVEEALSALFPNGWQGLDHGEVVRKVFLHLQPKKK